MYRSKKYSESLVQCPKCKDMLNTRISRSFTFRLLTLGLPIKIYFCPKCVTNRYYLVPRVHHQHRGHNEVTTA